MIVGSAVCRFSRQQRIQTLGTDYTFSLRRYPTRTVRVFILNSTENKMMPFKSASDAPVGPKLCDTTLRKSKAALFLLVAAICCPNGQFNGVPVDNCICVRESRHVYTICFPIVFVREPTWALTRPLRAGGWAATKTWTNFLLAISSARVSPKPASQHFPPRVLSPPRPPLVCFCGEYHLPGRVPALAGRLGNIQL